MRTNRLRRHSSLLATAALAAAAASLIACAQKITSEGVPAGRSHDGRYGTECYRNIPGEKDPYCSVPMARLIANPERFHGTNVELVGFLVRDEDRILLFPSQDSWYQGILNESLNLEVPKDDPQLMKLQHLLKDGYGGVVVMGRFNAMKEEANGMRLGTIQHVVRIFINPFGHGPEPLS